MNLRMSDSSSSLPEQDFLYSFRLPMKVRAYTISCSPILVHNPGCSAPEPSMTTKIFIATSSPSGLHTSAVLSILSKGLYYRSVGIVHNSHRQQDIRYKALSDTEQLDINAEHSTRTFRSPKAPPELHPHSQVHSQASPTATQTALHPLYFSHTQGMASAA